MLQWYWIHPEIEAHIEMDFTNCSFFFCRHLLLLFAASLSVRSTWKKVTTFSQDGVCPRAVSDASKPSSGKALEIWREAPTWRQKELFLGEGERDREIEGEGEGEKEREKECRSWNSRWDSMEVWVDVWKEGEEEEEEEGNSAGITYLPHLVVNHHIVRFHVTVHDSHTVTVVQSLTHKHRSHSDGWIQSENTQAGRSKLVQYLFLLLHNFFQPRTARSSPSVVRTCRNGCRNLSASGTTPAEEAGGRGRA